MRVLLISHTYFPSHYRGKLRWLATEGGVALTLAALPRMRKPSGPVLTFEEVAEPFQVRLLRPWAFSDHNVLRLYSPWRMARLLREAQPALVHVEAEPHSLLLALLAALKPHFGYRLVGFTWENLRRRGRGPLRWSEAWALRAVDGMIAGNAEAAEVLRWRGYRGPIAVIPQVGLDPGHFQREVPLPSPLASMDPGARIGFIGRLVPEKGVLDLLEAFIPLAERAHLVLVGTGPLQGSLQRRAEEAGIAARVHLVGFVPYSEVPAYLRGLDVLVLPSRTMPWWKEQFGHVLAEAMLAGVPVVGSASGAIPEVIGEAGLVFPEGDVAALRERLAHLLAYPKERERLAQAGKQRAGQRFTDQAIGRQTLQFYRQIMEAG
jgi:glycosyltransferase involved in cell wall biosynthesis